MIYLFLIVYVLTNQWVDRGYRYCQYSNGEVHAVSLGKICPHLIHR